MAAGKYSMLIEQGATVNISLAYKDSNNAAIDLTGYNARMKIRDNYADSATTTYFALSSSLAADGTGITLGGVSGTVGIFISAASTSVVNFDTAYYDLELVSGSTNPIVTRLIQGTVKLSKEVTR
jgi:hypothetical protein